MEELVDLAKRSDQDGVYDSVLIDKLERADEHRRKERYDHAERLIREVKESLDSE